MKMKKNTFTEITLNDEKAIISTRTKFGITNLEAKGKHGKEIATLEGTVTVDLKKGTTATAVISWTRPVLVPDRS